MANHILLCCVFSCHQKWIVYTIVFGVHDCIWWRGKTNFNFKLYVGRTKGLMTWTANWLNQSVDSLFKCTGQWGASLWKLLITPSAVRGLPRPHKVFGSGSRLILYISSLRIVKIFTFLRLHRLVSSGRYHLDQPEHVRKTESSHLWP